MQRLHAGTVAGRQWHLLDWQPIGERGQLEIKLADGTRGFAQLQLTAQRNGVLSLVSMQLLSIDTKESNDALIQQ